MTIDHLEEGDEGEFNGKDRNQLHESHIFVALQYAGEWCLHIWLYLVLSDKLWTQRLNDCQW